MHVVQMSTRRDFYGGEACLQSLAEGLVARGHRVTCLVQPDSALCRRLAGGTVEVAARPLVDWFDPATVARVRGVLCRTGADVLATHLPRDWFIGAVAAAGLPVVHVATRHVLGRVRWPVLKRPFVRRCARMIAVSEAVADGLRRSELVPSGRIVTVPNGVAAPVTTGDPRRALRERLGIPAGAPVVGLVGRLEPAKGAHDLVGAAVRLRDLVPGLHVVVLGGGPAAYRRGLVAQANEGGLAGRIHLPGYVPGAAALAAGLDVQVVGSRAEPFGLATIEALAAGVPVVGTDTGGTPEIVRDGVEGFLVRPGDVPALANRLLCLLESRGLRREMGRRGRARYRARFTRERMVAATAAVYDAALSERDAGGPTACATGPD